MDIDIGEEWFGIADGLNSFINNIVMALDWCKNVFSLNIFRSNGWILIKFCIFIDKYKMHLVFNAHYFWSIFNRVMALEFCLFSIFSISCELICGFRSNFVYALILTRCRFGWLNNIFVHFQQSYGPWLMLKFCLCSISCEPINWWILIKFCKCIDIDKM